jgi:fused signal recognition particle receptor
MPGSQTRSVLLWCALMDSAFVHDLVPVLVTIGVLGGAGSLAVVAARRARAARRRQIEAADDPRMQPPPRRKLQLDEAEPEPAAPAPAAPESPAVQPGEAERPSAQVLPFPRPGAPALPVDKPTVPSTAFTGKKRDARALSPGLAKTRAGWVARLGQLFSGKREIDPALVDELEKVLLTADIGVRTSQKLLGDLRKSLDRKELGEPSAVWEFLRQRCREVLSVGAPPVDFSTHNPFVLLIIGVNGSGKTTTIGKLAAQLRAEGRTVLLAAGDTFRAAATEQLEVWGARVDVPVVRGKEGADPSSVIFDAIRRAKAEGIQVVIADTAGRLHTKTDLMQELQKVRRVVGRAEEGAPHETWLVIDATSGQNAIAQAQIFTQAMSVSGIVLTKLDGTAKGGVILGIADQLGIPVRYIGVGERVEDLREFDPDEFVEALFEGQRPPPGPAGPDQRADRASA